jgi:hypothetical protein
MNDLSTSKIRYLYLQKTHTQKRTKRIFGMTKSIAHNGMSMCYVNTGVRDRSCSSRYCVNCARFLLLKCDIIVTNAVRCLVVYIYKKMNSKKNKI